jgi:hypothetical protein
MRAFKELLDILEKHPSDRFGNQIAIPYAKHGKATVHIYLRHDARSLELCGSEIEIVVQGVGQGLPPEFAEPWLVAVKSLLN